MSFTVRWQQELESFHQVYDRYGALRGEGALGEAMTYALAGQGKRVRPLFCLLASAAAGGTITQALQPALSLELIHTYSLIHDDLPCMDDDDLRRGRPTVHKQFDEPTALLVGDAILTDAFHVVTQKMAGSLNLTPLPADRIGLLIEELSEAAGFTGMVEGQAQDLLWTGRQGATREVLDHIHAKKTGALLGASVACGAIAAGASHEKVAACRKFGQDIGLAFQIIDDLLDESQNIGKTAGKDKETGKLTYATYMDRDQAMRIADDLTKNAVQAVETTLEHPEELVALAAKLLDRNS